MYVICICADNQSITVAGELAENYLFQKKSVRFPYINPQNRLLLWKTFKRNTTIFSSRMRLFGKRMRC